MFPALPRHHQPHPLHGLMKPCHPTACSCPRPIGESIPRGRCHTAIWLDESNNYTADCRHPKDCKKGVPNWEACLQSRLPPFYLPKRFLLGLRWQAAEEDQVRHFHHVRVLRQLLNRVASVAQDSLLTIDVADFGDDCRGVGVPGRKRKVQSSGCQCMQNTLTACPSGATALLYG